MENKKVIETIKKVLELSKNNPSTNEAKAAALKAQALMAKYHISMEEISVEEKEEISESNVSVGTGNKWKYTLSQIIAKNFRCKTFSYGSDVIVFYGFDTDAKIASMTFDTLFQIGKKGADNHYQNKYNAAKRNGEYFNGRGLKNAFLLGYLEGIRSELEKQSVALMVIVPEEVKVAYEVRSENFKVRNCSIRYGIGNNGKEARESGRRLGRDSVRARQLASAAV